MSKKLSAMTLEELWELFPIVLSEHKPYWADWYKEEAMRLEKILPKGTALHHVGSTAVVDIMAKPIIDIIVVVNSNEQLKQAADILQEHGCIVMSAGENRISLNKGYTENGFAEKVFHFHLRLTGDTDEIFFRDYLKRSPRDGKRIRRIKA